MITKLSALKAGVVDNIYNIDTAKKTDNPVFLFLVGAPGAGKSSGHAKAKSLGILPENYATMNVDLLLESLIPFRASSSIAHLLKHIPETKDLVKFSSIGAYTSKKENVGSFKWFDDIEKRLHNINPDIAETLEDVRSTYEPLQKSATAKLIDIHDRAIARAIKKKVNIVLETTLSLTKGGRVKKVDEIMKLLSKSTYKVVFLHIYCDPEEVASRLQNRQEYEMPQDEYPYYRYVPANVEAVKEYMQSTKEAFNTLKTQYTDATFEEFENPNSKRRSFHDIDPTVQLKKIVKAYGKTRKSKKK